MGADSNDIKREIILHLLGEGTPESEDALRRWLAEKPENEALFGELCQEHRLAAKMAVYQEVDTEKSLQKNLEMLDRRSARRRRVRILRYAAAAVVAAVVVAVGLNRNTTAVMPQIGGMKQAELILEDGRSFLLEEGLTMDIPDEGSAIRVSDNCISYAGGDASGKMDFHRIITPLGGEYQLTLSDGTRVWLNAMSRIRFPKYFDDERREVEIEGECYFEVAESSVPFVVTAGGCDILVLGTKFNVAAYPDEDRVLTTLCQGRVEISDSTDPQNRCTIEPGQQLSFDKATHNIAVCQTDTDLYTAWTKGRFQYDNNTVEEVFNSLQRWYDIEVVFANEQTRDEVFTGIFPRFSDIGVILELMEKVSDLRFEVEGRKIIVR